MGPSSTCWPRTGSRRAPTPRRCWWGRSSTFAARSRSTGFRRSDALRPPERSFASDNNAGVHPDVLSAVAAANRGHVVGYGDDPYTRSAERLFQKHFGSDAALFPVFNGTGANVLCLKALTQPYHAVICSEAAHVQVDECGAPEAWTGCKLLPLHCPDGKLTPKAVESACHGVGDQHHVQPRVISIAQSTELGTVYRPREVEALARFAHARGMFLHMDGARISNAAASL